jgi:hypothetical protein
MAMYVELACPVRSLQRLTGWAALAGYRTQRKALLLVKQDATTSMVQSWLNGCSQGLQDRS